MSVSLATILKVARTAAVASDKNNSKVIITTIAIIVGVIVILGAMITYVMTMPFAALANVFSGDNLALFQEFYSEEEDNFEDILYNRKDDFETNGNPRFASPFPEDWRGKISSSFGLRIDPYTYQESFHGGVDIAYPSGTNIYAVTKGSVVIATYSQTAGNYVVVQDEDGYIVRYLHCNSLLVQKGMTVEQGDLIGTVGTTGSSTGNHLHLDIANPFGQYMDPVILIFGYEDE